MYLAKCFAYSELSTKNNNFYHCVTGNDHVSLIVTPMQQLLNFSGRKENNHIISTSLRTSKYVNGKKIFCQSRLTWELRLSEGGEKK